MSCFALHLCRSLRSNGPPLTNVPAAGAAGLVHCQCTQRAVSSGGAASMTVCPALGGVRHWAYLNQTATALEVGTPSVPLPTGASASWDRAGPSCSRCGKLRLVPEPRPCAKGWQTGGTRENERTASAAHAAAPTSHASNSSPASSAVGSHWVFECRGRDRVTTPAMGG